MTDVETPVTVDGNETKPAATESTVNAKASFGILAIFIAIIVIGAIATGATGSKEDESTTGGSSSIIDTEAEEMSSQYFERISTFAVCEQLDPNCNVDDETVAEIVSATVDGMTLVYTDGKQESIGFVDISDPSKPSAAGLVAVGGESTSVAVYDENYVVTSVNTSPDFINTSGVLQVVSLSDDKSIVASIDLGGQPDAIAVSPDKSFIAVAIENERDEDLNDGLIPQMPAGYLAVIDSSADDPSEWTMSKVELTGLEGVLYESDPEPEFVAINENNVAVVTMQENNGIALVDLNTMSVMKSFTAGAVDLEMIDTEDNGIILQDSSLSQVKREPDGVTWIGTDYFATANEGDLDGGSRGFSIYNLEGEVVYESGSFMDQYCVKIGHYNEGRSGKKGNEPENVFYGVYGDEKLLFVNSERSSVVFVYEVSDVTKPVFKQVLPTALAPEGSVAITARSLFIVASEEDDRGDKIRSGLNIYELKSESMPSYPTLFSEEGIPFSALSGLSYNAQDGFLYSVDDSFYSKSRIFKIDVSVKPYKVVEATQIKDMNGLLPESLVNADDMTVNLDLEGVEAMSDGTFWVVSEGRGTIGDESRPFESPNLLLHVTPDGTIAKAVTFPEEYASKQVRFGLEGVAVEGDMIVTTTQRAWTNETNPRLGIYDLNSDSWKFVYYPLDAPESQVGGWVGLSDIAAVGDMKFLILERDNQGGPDAAIKRIYLVDLAEVEEGSTITKTLVQDIIPDLKEATNGFVMEKVEGLAYDGEYMWINNDNDGVDDNSGEQLLLKLGAFTA